MGRLDDVTVIPQRHFGPRIWAEMSKEAEIKRKHFENDPNTRVWGQYHELRGIVAEETVARALDLKRHGKLTDGGEDFFKTDVKGIPPVRPQLAIPTHTKKGKATRLVAEYYVCVVVDCRQRWATILGWTTRDGILSAEVSEIKHGPCWVLRPWELNPGLPDELVQYANLMKGVKNGN